MKSDQFFYFWAMRILLAFSFLLLSTIGHGQDAANFLREKQYLIEGMSGMNVGENRVGLWRLSPAVAVRYGLIVEEGYDQRLDMTWSTEAAMKWYEDLYDMYEDTLLADDAFVNGPSHAIRINNDATAYLQWKRKVNRWKSGPNTSHRLPQERESEVLIGPVYWDDLQNELNLTSSEFASFLAINPSIVGERLGSEIIATVWIDRQIDEFIMSGLLASAHERDSVARRELSSIRNRILNDIPDPSTHNRISYRVRSGDVLGSIAQRYRVGLTDLKKWNGLRSNMIRIGQELVIYVPRGVATAAVTTETASEQEGSVRSDEEDRQEVQYRVKSGDTLWSIARAYPGISADDIMRWNGITEDIREGQVIMILVQNASEE